MIYSVFKYKWEITIFYVVLFWHPVANELQNNI